MVPEKVQFRLVLQEDMLREMAVRLASDITYKGTNPDHISEDLYFKSDFELHCMCQDTEVSLPKICILKSSGGNHDFVAEFADFELQD